MAKFALENICKIPLALLEGQDFLPLLVGQSSFQKIQIPG
jgi:hypothetical protein